MNINWMEMIVGDILLAVILSGIFAMVQAKSGNQNEKAIEKMLQEKINVLHLEHEMIQQEISSNTKNTNDKIDAAVNILEKSGANGQTQGK